MLEQLDHVVGVFAAALVAHIFLVPGQRRAKQLLAWLHRRVQRVEHASGVPVALTPVDLRDEDATDPGVAR